MNISSPVRTDFSSDAISVASQGINQQIERLDRNVAEVARAGLEESSGNSITTALVDQLEIVRAVEANAKSLQVANQTLGTLLDVTV
ncbi:MAG: flagellar basal body rod C-terminal domain-containing protein [Pseudomonadota bacterium]